MACYCFNNLKTIQALTSIFYNLNHHPQSSSHFQWMQFLLFIQSSDTNCAHIASIPIRARIINILYIPLAMCWLWWIAKWLKCINFFHHAPFNFSDYTPLVNLMAAEVQRVIKKSYRRAFFCSSSNYSNHHQIATEWVRKMRVYNHVIFHSALT